MGNAHPDELNVRTHGQEPMHRGHNVVRVARDDGIIADDKAASHILVIIIYISSG